MIPGCLSQDRHRTGTVGYSITSSARTSRVCGIARPRPFAAFLLITNSSASASRLAGPLALALAAQKDAAHQPPPVGIPENLWRAERGSQLAGRACVQHRAQDAVDGPCELP